MLKKFVSLNAESSPTKNPYEIRTYMGDSVRTPDWKVELCQFDRKCPKPGNSTISKVLTIEDELRRLHQKAKESRLQRPFRKKCQRFDDFSTCVVTQRTPKELKVNALMREKYLKATIDLKARVHEAGASDAISEVPSLVQLNSPTFQADENEEGDDYDDEGEEEEDGEPRKINVKPRPASPSCSMDYIFMPPQKLVSTRNDKCLQRM